MKSWWLNANQNIDAPLIVCRDRVLSRRDVGAMAMLVRDALHEQGIGAGDIVAVRSTAVSAIAELLGAWSLGATTWLCPLREPASKVDRMGRDLGAIFPSTYPPLEKGVGGFSLNGTSENPPTPFSKGGQISSLLHDLLNTDAATLINTSGSTGSPKFVVHSLSQHFESAAGVNQHMELDETHSWLLSLPLYHVGGLAIVIRALHAGASIVVPAEGQSLEDVVREQRITHLSLVQTQLKRLMADPEIVRRLGDCRRVVLGGGPVPSWLGEAAKKLTLPIVASYGATEMASMWTATKFGAESVASQGSGTLLPSRELRISCDNEVRVRGPMLFRRYHQSSLQPFDESGFYCTGDLGHIDDRGNLHILGRRDNMFISGGENIHPEEIESALLAHPSVQEAVVVSVPNAQWGERPVAFVRSTGDLRIADEELRAHLRTTLPSFKIPDRFFDWPASEREGLKPSRSRLRQLARAPCLNVFAIATTK